MEQARQFKSRLPEQSTGQQANQYLVATPSGTARKSNDHAFSRVVAQEYGITAALVLKYLAYRIGKSRVVFNDRQWHCQSVANIRTHYPYLSPSAIHAALQKVPDNVLLRRSVKNRWTSARSTSYTFADPNLTNRLNADLLYFSSDHAVQYGVHEAILLHKIEHWLRERRKKQYDYRFHPMPPQELSEKLLISRASISRALKNLVGKGVLEKNPNPKGKVPSYALNSTLNPVRMDAAQVLNSGTQGSKAT